MSTAAFGPNTAAMMATGIPKRAALYVRVSTASRSRHGDSLVFDQHPDVQEQPLRQLAAQRGWAVTNVYSDSASGAKERRPGLDALNRRPAGTLRCGGGLSI